MAGLHELREDYLMQSDDSTCSASTDHTSGTIFVGIDLGACFSGISYGRFDPQDVAFPRCWIHTATLGDVSGSRVQTRIPVNYYDKHFKGPFLEWFKMSLFRKEGLPDNVLRSSKVTELTILHQSLKVSAVTAMVDYLKLLWSDFHGSLDLYVYDFEYNLIIAVPGNWPVYVRRMMLEAIHKANILSDKVHLSPKFISDIEAASIALVLDLSKEHNDTHPILKAGDVVVVCDCGSFTTEFTAYKICLIQSLQMDEITRAECIFAGGALIDNAFMNLLKAKIKKKHPRSIIDLSMEELREIAHDHWEKDMKCNFSGDRREWTFEVPYGGGYTNTSMTISFSAFELALIFDPIVDKITSQIKGLFDHDSIRGTYQPHVIIAGGFGRSPYVQTRIKQVVYKHNSPVTVHCPPGDQGCTAVSRGAVLRELQGFGSASLNHRKTQLYVTSRIVRASYGVALYPELDTIWLLKEGERLSAVEHHRVSLPPEAISTTDTIDGLSNTVWLFYKSRDNSYKQPFCKIFWPLTGPKTELVVDFEWDSIHMEVSILHEGRKLDGLSTEYCPRA
ncbi:hypothetical protein FPSE_07090 [Fusarium pseudograminearum CS3096]|uniref:Actin-like ATPase domain-containing protein n=1 Tax=Fusarium pseudograminearum (strain CS3096) TaxID=1028729 RepID=K3VZN1_FUSPC|nr:hypothetical protein FPSE_07090 [Fusarium pseudograminearum CS3096]EKJ72690.1 hypothetical protein FPSE_07090 [Fusarium pseudograminearum CS3096]